MLPRDVVEFGSVEVLLERWQGGVGLTFRPISVTGDAARLIVRVRRDELPIAERFVASHLVTVRNRPVEVRLAVQPQPDDFDSSVAHLRDRFVGTHVDEARPALEAMGWIVRAGAPQDTSTADHVPNRLTLVADQDLIIDLVSG